MGKQAAPSAAAPPGLPLHALKLSRKALAASEINEHMLLVPGVLSVSEAQRLIDAAEALGFQHQSSRGPAFGEAFRDNHRISVTDAVLAQRLWADTGLKQVLAGVSLDGMEPIGLNANLRFYRYERGQKFGKHIDDSVEVAPGQVTGYTLLIYLSGQPSGCSSGGNASQLQQQQHASSSSSSKGKQQAGRRTAQQQQQQQPGGGGGSSSRSAVQPLVGGETLFYSDRGKLVASVAPAPGLALLHLHGEERCLEHEAAEVTQGVKYVLRSDVVFGAAA